MSQGLGGVTSTDLEMRGHIWLRQGKCFHLTICWKIYWFKMSMNLHSTKTHLKQTFSIYLPFTDKYVSLQETFTSSRHS